MVNRSICLVGDVGGTNARFGIAWYDAGARRHILNSAWVAPTCRYPTFDAALAAYVNELGEGMPARACIAVAGPVDDDGTRFTNNDWAISKTALRARFGFAELEVVNDFAALASSVPQLQGRDLARLKAGTPCGRAPCLILGPGTGFGVAALTDTGASRNVLASEGGHTAYAPRDQVERDLVRLIGPEPGVVSIENLLSGRGLVRLHQALMLLHGRGESHSDPSTIVEAALGGADELAGETLCRFAAMLAAVASDLALTFGARGGVYIGGGIAPRIQSFLEQPLFVERFLDNAAMRHYLDGIPVQLIRHEYAALLGAAAWLDNPRGST